VENRQLVKFIGNNILDSSGVFSKILTSEDVDDVISRSKNIEKNLLQQRFDDAWAEKLKKIKLPQHRFS